MPGISTSRSFTSGAAWLRTGLPVIAVYQPAHARQVRFGGRLERVQQVDDRVKGFVARDEVARFVRERALGKRRDVAAEHEERHVGHDVLDRGRQRRGSRHVLGGCRRLVTIDDDGGEHRRQDFTRSATCSGVSSSASASTISTEKPFARANVAMRPAQTGFSTAVSRFPRDW